MDSLDLQSLSPLSRQASRLRVGTTTIRKLLSLSALSLPSSKKVGGGIVSLERREFEREKKI